jgi:phospholipid/cholesterol/gamma-HCH transport system substrate-binding protein
MKFKIRYADQIVGLLVILGRAALAFIVILKSDTMRWFKDDGNFYTVLDSADGLSKNMDIKYKGFVIGKVKSFDFAQGDKVRVDFTIYEDYMPRITQGSIVELMAGPIAIPIFPNQFLFHFGRGPEMNWQKKGFIFSKSPPSEFIPALGSTEARQLIARGLAAVPESSDDISIMINSISSLLANLDGALGAGSETELGQMVGSLNSVLVSTDNLVENLDVFIDELIGNVVNIVMAELKPILAGVEVLIGNISEPGGILNLVFDPEEDLYASLDGSLSSISGILDSLDRTVAFLPSQLPQIGGLIMELRTTMKTAEDTLTALNNNPLLRGGIPDRPETQQNVGPRSIRF